MSTGKEKKKSVTFICSKFLFPYNRDVGTVSRARDENRPAEYPGSLRMLEMLCFSLLLKGLLADLRMRRYLSCDE